MVTVENILEGLDPNAVMRILPQKIAEAEDTLVSTSLTLMALRQTEGVSPDELAATEHNQKLQRGYRDNLVAYKRTLDAALEGKSAKA